MMLALWFAPDVSANRWSGECLAGLRRARRARHRSRERPQVAQQRGDRAPALDLGRAVVPVLAGILVALGGTRREPAMGAAAPVRHGRRDARRALPGACPA